ncbi:hypothetical protein DFH28DRAFT_1119316 [Melampsora americana]|nr:hypothetical protein DFH28DRAFT_1119316 [Melampsora americana]
MLFFKSIILSALVATISTTDIPNNEKNKIASLRRSLDISSPMIRRHPDGEPTGGCGGGGGGGGEGH